MIIVVSLSGVSLEPLMMCGIIQKHPGKSTKTKCFSHLLGKKSLNLFHSFSLHQSMVCHGFIHLGEKVAFYQIKKLMREK